MIRTLRKLYRYQTFGQILERFSSSWRRKQWSSSIANISVWIYLAMFSFTLCDFSSLNDQIALVKSNEINPQPAIPHRVAMSMLKCFWNTNLEVRNVNSNISWNPVCFYRKVFLLLQLLISSYTMTARQEIRGQAANKRHYRAIYTDLQKISCFQIV